MSRSKWIGLAWLGACALAQAGVTTIPVGARLVSPDERLPAPAQVARDVAAPAAALRRGDAGAALAQLAALKGDMRFEATAVALIEQVQIEAPGAAAERLLQALAQERVRLFRRHEETAGDWFVPLYDVPGRAASARVMLATRGARDRLLPKLRAGDAAAVRTGEVPAAAAVAAIELLSQTEAEGLAAAIMAQGMPIESRVRASLARRVPTPAFLASLLARGEAADVLPLLQTLPASLEVPEALAWLESAAQQREYRSAATVALGGLLVRSPLAEEKLVRLLADPSAEVGASAALAFATLESPDRLQRIDALVSRSKDQRELSRLALALRLEGSPAALERLQRLSVDPRLPEAARKELQR